MMRILILSLLVTFFQAISSAQSNEKALNFIIIFADDLGYGDLSCYGHPTIHTKNLDKMASEGQKWTNFYAGASVCTPSRAALLTGRLPIRSGMASSKSRVLFPDSHNGLPQYEITLAEQMRSVGYTTACIGKWHLGHKEEYLPTNHGFDYYFGIPYSNDMDRVPGSTKKDYWQQPDDSIRVEHFNVPLLRNTEIIERPANQKSITKRYSEEAVTFIQENKEQPFFIYLAHNLPHIPLFASEDAMGKSGRGLYGDVVQEIDDGVGKILEVLKNEGLDKNTVVVFTSDNGPWLPFKEDGGSAGLLRAGKGSTWEGGMREPCIFWGPGNIEPGLVTEMGSTLDLLPTFSKMAGAALPEDRIIDGVDLSPTLKNLEASPRNSMIYYRGSELFAARLGDYKAHFITQGAYGINGERIDHDTPQLYNLSHDPSEKYEIGAGHPEVIEQIQAMVNEHKSKMVMGKDQLEARGQ